MPITSSAKKALRGSFRKRDDNLARKGAIDKTLKEFRKLLGEKKVAEAQALVSKIQQVADKAAKTGYIKLNKAARIKSRAIAALLKVKRG